MNVRPALWLLTAALFIGQTVGCADEQTSFTSLPDPCAALAGPDITNILGTGDAIKPPGAPRGEIFDACNYVGDRAEILITYGRHGTSIADADAFLERARSTDDPTGTADDREPVDIGDRGYFYRLPGGPIEIRFRVTNLNVAVRYPNRGPVPPISSEIRQRLTDVANVIAADLDRQLN